MKVLVWWLVACLGIACFVVAYRLDAPIDASRPFSTGFIYVAKPGLPPPKNLAFPVPATPVRIRLLPAAGFSAQIAEAISKADAAHAKSVELPVFERVVEISLKHAGITEKDLAWGRLPRPGANEVIAGERTVRHDEIDVAGKRFAVVGGLPRGMPLFARSYLVPIDQSVHPLFVSTDQKVRAAVLVSLTTDQMRRDEVKPELKTQFPPDKFEVFASTEYMQRDHFLEYMLGQAVWCLAGSGGLIGLYIVAATRFRGSWLGPPLQAIMKHRRLLWTIHIVFFALYLVGALIAYEVPEIQSVFTAATRREIQSGGGPLGVAGTAYLSRSIPRAAAVTFCVNFFLGSLLCITLPSCIIPGVGVVVALFRAALWGLLLAPASRTLARGMLLHSGTLLLEGEGYILATFFGLLVPLFLLQPEQGPKLYRYGRAVLLNLKGNLLVAIVLVVAAIYEAIEVIAIM